MHGYAVPQDRKALTQEGPMADMSRFWDRHAKGYAKRPVADEAAYRQKLKVTQNYLKPDMEVLEFGCGTGTTALIQAPFVKHILATDISGGMLEIARAKAAAQGVGNVTFQQVSIEELDAPDASFDVVMGHSILHLLQDRKAAIAKVHRMLRPGGAFVTSTACPAPMTPWWLTGRRRPSSSSPGASPETRTTPCPSWTISPRSTATGR